MLFDSSYHVLSKAKHLNPLWVELDIFNSEVNWLKCLKLIIEDEVELTIGC